MKAVILVCAIAATALAAPRYKRTTRLDATLSEHVRSAEQAWTAAEREPDPARQPVLWEQAAGAFAVVDGDPVDAKVKREAAYAAVLAWKNTLAVDLRIQAPGNATGKPGELPDRDLKLIAAIDRYAKYADPSDAELPGLLFIKARTHLQVDQLEIAIPILRSIVDRYPQHEAAGYAAQSLLASFNRLHQDDRLVAFADELANNAKFLRGRDELAATVTKIQRQAKRKRVEQLEAAARADHDLEKYAAVGTAYLDLYNANPQAPEGDELLYNAGVSFETSHAISGATQAFALLQQRYPQSKLVPRSLARLARIYANVAMYDKAAERLEEYAKKYAGEKDAYQALSDAVYYRRAIGDRDKAIADTEFFVRTFGLKRPREAADATWSLTALYENDPDRAIAQLRTYLRTYGTKGGAERVVIAHAKIGQLLWKQSCPVPGIDGLCVKPEIRTGRSCGARTTPAMAAITRDPRKTKEALAAFANAIREYERNPGSDGAARYYYAQAKLAVADAELEPWVALAAPRGLDFDPDNSATRSASMKRFSEWTERKQRTGATVRRKYEAALDTKDPATSITAAARMGIIAQSFATDLFTNEIPRGASGARVTAFCDAMTGVAEPLEATAVTSFTVCLVKSTELAWFGESSRSCERELIRMKPAEFPAATELRSQPLAVGAVIDIEPPL